jgi:hypothetical protein
MQQSGDFRKGALRLSLVSIQLAILHRFRDVHTPDAVTFREIRDGSRHLKDAMISSGGEIQSADGLPEKAFPRVIRHAVFIDVLHRQPGVGVALSCQLPLVRSLYPAPDRLA